MELIAYILFKLILGFVLYLILNQIVKRGWLSIPFPRLSLWEWLICGAIVLTIVTPINKFTLYSDRPVLEVIVLTLVDHITWVGILILLELSKEA